MMYVRLIFLALLFFAAAATAHSDDWPDWRGAGRDGDWRESEVGKTFDSERMRPEWRAPVSAGYSGPTVADGRVYLTDHVKEPDEIERVLCFDAGTGEPLWSHSYACAYSGIGYPAGPRASVVVDGGRVYSLGSMGDLFCLESETGAVLWHIPLPERYDTRMPVWGMVSAPLVVDDTLIVQAGGRDNACVVALDKLSGEEVWRNLNDDASYSAPILIEQAGARVLVVWTGQRLAGMNPETGEVHWQQEFEQPKTVINISTPVLHDNHIFVSSFYDGSMLVELDGNSLNASMVWKRQGRNERETDALHCCISTPLFRDGHIYGVDSYGQMRCLEMETGDRVWEDLTAVEPDRWANIHFVQNGEATWLFNEHGELLTGLLSPSGFTEISRTRIIEPTTEQLNRKGVGVTWAHPAFANRHVYIRNDRELVCVYLGE